MPLSPRQRHPSRRAVAAQRGTTLIELMVGLVILTILTSLALPSMNALMGRYNVRSAADDLLYAADLARSRARANRVAYALQIGATGSDGEFLQLWLRRGVDPTCASAAAGSGEVVYQRDFHKNNTANDPEIVILARAPGELASAGLALCFKPDGRVVRADTELPFSGPGAGYLAGDVYYELSRVVGTTPIGDRLQVQIGYNGSLRLVFGRDLTKLQGGS